MLRLCGLLATAGFCASVTAATEVDVLRSEIELLQTKMSILEKPGLGTARDHWPTEVPAANRGGAAT